jgi:hypothetical protein
MTFTHGQRVRIKGKQSVGTVEKMLTSLNDVYIVKVDSSLPDEERLVRGEDLESFAEVA